MGFISSLIFAIFVILLASVLIDRNDAKLVPSPTDSQQLSNNDLQKRPTMWLKRESYPMIRRNKQLSAPNDIEFIDETDDGIKKRFDNYGHMRFGKRSGPPGEGFDDYGDYG